MPGGIAKAAEASGGDDAEVGAADASEGAWDALAMPPFFAAADFAEGSVPFPFAVFPVAFDGSCACAVVGGGVGVTGTAACPCNGADVLTSGLGVAVVAVVAGIGAGTTGCGNISRTTGDVATSSFAVIGSGSIGALAQAATNSATKAAVESRNIRGFIGSTLYAIGDTFIIQIATRIFAGTQIYIATRIFAGTQI